MRRGLEARISLHSFDELADVLQLLVELGDFERGEPRQTHVEDFSGLFFRQLEALP